MFPVCQVVVHAIRESYIYIYIHTNIYIEKYYICIVYINEFLQNFNLFEKKGKKKSFILLSCKGNTYDISGTAC